MKTARISGELRERMELRVEAIKKKLPYMYMNKYISQFPHHNNLFDINKVRDVVNKRRFDEEIITNLESLVDNNNFF
jgi:hypothetical protein